MADAAVQLLLENLQQLFTYHLRLITGAEEQVERLQNDLRLFKQFLKDTAKKRRTENSFGELVRQIRDVVHKAEDVIDSFVIHAAERKLNHCVMNFFKAPLNLHGIAVEVARVRSEVDEIYGGRSRLGFVAETMGGGDNGDDKRVKAPLVREENIVGFEDEEEKLQLYINEPTQRLGIISIVGMPGLGKTTLARKIYRDPKIAIDFPTRIWIYVSQDFTGKDVFISILRQLGTKIDDGTYQKTDQELAQEVRNRLERLKFFMVMDDIWTTSDWDELKVAFPRNNNTGKVLITCRMNTVANYASPESWPLMLRFLTHEESWLLLKYEVFKNRECPNELEVLGKLIAKNCNGVPLALVVMGGILVKKFSSDGDMNATKDMWANVSNSVNAYLKDDPERRIEKLIALSYDSLPYYLRECFLYLGIFPEDFEIPTWKLTQMWIAEGFIQKKDDSISLEEAADNYLDDLINMNLVRIEKRRSDGKAKTCRIHDMFRDFCKTEAGNERENFLQEIKFSADRCLEPSVDDIKKYRRICMHSNVMALVSAKPFGPHVRSFVSCSRQETILPKGSNSAIPSAFKLLRVLEAKTLKFKKIPKVMYHLVHLRYIHLSFKKLNVIPRSFSKLWNVQTLIVDTTSRTLKIEAMIWKMMYLTHLKTNTITTLPKPGKTISEGSKLQTLGTISPENCTNEFFDQARNLKKLGIRGKLTALLDGKIDSLGRLINLEKLKLLNVCLDALSDVSLRALPPSYKFPSKLKSMTLSETYLDWEHISVLGKLENLVVLKLKNKAFTGKTWVTTDGGFRNLQILLIEGTDLVIWEASAHHFPRLTRLELRECEGIQAIPVGFAEIRSLQWLHLYHASQAANSAKTIRDAKENSGFKLIVYPPVE